MRLEEFLVLLENRIQSAPKNPVFLAGAILCAIKDARQAMEQEQEDSDAIWHDMMASSMGQD